MSRAMVTPLPLFERMKKKAIRWLWWFAIIGVSAAVLVQVYGSWRYPIPDPGCELDGAALEAARAAAGEWGGGQARLVSGRVAVARFEFTTASGAVASVSVADCGGTWRPVIDP